MRPQTYDITFVGQAGVTLSAEFDDCAITTGPDTTTPFAPRCQIRVPVRGWCSGLTASDLKWWTWTS